MNSSQIVLIAYETIRDKLSGRYYKKDFAADIGIFPQDLSGLFSGKKQIGRVYADKLSNALTKHGFDVTSGHILDGLKSDDWLLIPENQPVGIPHINGKPINGEPVTIPYFRVSAAAGSGAFIEDRVNAQQLYFMSGWIQNGLGTSAKNLIALDVYGDSMEPTLHHGDTVLVDKTRNHLKTNGLYVFEIGDMLLIKRVELLPDNSILVKSDNQAYAPFEIKPGEEEHFSVKGRVVWRGGTEF